METYYEEPINCFLLHVLNPDVWDSINLKTLILRLQIMLQKVLTENLHCLVFSYEETEVKHRTIKWTIKKGKEKKKIFQTHRSKI